MLSYTTTLATLIQLESDLAKFRQQCEAIKQSSLNDMSHTPYEVQHTLYMLRFTCASCRQLEQNLQHLVTWCDTKSRKELREMNRVRTA
jgi:hypothetical protein